MRIFGLQSAEGLKLNGLEGKLQSLSPETGRWNVILDSGEEKAIKPTNLEVRPGTASWWLPIFLQLLDLESRIDVTLERSAGLLRACGPSPHARRIWAGPLTLIKAGESVFRTLY